MEVAIGVVLVGVALLLIIDFATAKRRPQPVDDDKPTLDVQNHIGN